MQALSLSSSPLRRRGRRREIKIQLVLTLLFSYASASNPFSSNVVLLTQKNCGARNV